MRKETIGFCLGSLCSPSLCPPPHLPPWVHFNDLLKRPTAPEDQMFSKIKYSFWITGQIFKNKHSGNPTFEWALSLIPLGSEPLFGTVRAAFMTNVQFEKDSFKGGNVLCFGEWTKSKPEPCFVNKTEDQAEKQNFASKKKCAYKTRKLICHMAFQLNFSKFVKNQFPLFTVIPHNFPCNTRIV